jgi:hypothetical protein
LGAGAVSGSLIGKLPSKGSEIGPVCAVSFRVASRIANALRAGYAARSADELNDVQAVLFHSPPEQAQGLLAVLEGAAIEWKGKALVFCDCSAPDDFRQRMQGRAASIAAVREFGIPGRMIVEVEKGRDSMSAAALRTVHRIVRQMHVKTAEIPSASSALFDAAVVLGSAAITPLIDHAAALLRDAGIRDTDAAQIASALFEHTARDYAHSGKQSWLWHVRKPDAARLRELVAASGPNLTPMFRQLLLAGFERFKKHPDVAAQLVAGGE